MGQTPHFAYTIGLLDRFGFELVIAGGFISTQRYECIVNSICSGLNSGSDVNSIFKSVDGDKRLIEMHCSWSKKTALWVYDYFKMDSVKTLQVFPLDGQLLDVPTMSEPFDEKDPVWKWLSIDWNIDAPKTAYAITNVQFLRGDTITEVVRFEEGYWEMFVGNTNEVADGDVRVLPLGVMIGIDNSLESAIQLGIGCGLYRDNKETGWKDWD